MFLMPTAISLKTARSIPTPTFSAQLGLEEALASAPVGPEVNGYRAENPKYTYKLISMYT